MCSSVLYRMWSMLSSTMPHFKIASLRSKLTNITNFWCRYECTLCHATIFAWCDWDFMTLSYKAQELVFNAAFRYIVIISYIGNIIYNKWFWFRSLICLYNWVKMLWYMILVSTFIANNLCARTSAFLYTSLFHRLGRWFCDHTCRYTIPTSHAHWKIMQPQW